MSIDRRANGKWQARWRETPNGTQKTKQFVRKVDAVAFLTGIEHSKLPDQYIDPSSGKTILGPYAREWADATRTAQVLPQRAI